MLITLLPYIGALVLLIFMLLPSTPNYNRYGPPVGDPTAETFAEYRGWTRAEALQRFGEDAQRASASGYDPVHEQWRRVGNEEVLIVGYARRAVPPWQSPGPPQPPMFGGGLG